MSAFQNSSPEEVFRFSVVRNPVDISSKKFQDTVVEIVREGDGAYEYTKILIDLRQHATRKELIAEVERLINAPEFMDRLYGRPTPIWLYVERLQRLPKLSLSSARDLIEEVFGKKASELWASQNFRGDIDFIADCLVLASVVSPPLSGLRTKLMLARRAGAFIERLASTSDQGEAGSERLLMATLLLPTLVFPIPDENNSGSDKNKKAYNRRKALLEKKNAKAQLLLNKLSRNRAAAEELSTGLTRHLFELNQYSKEDTEQSSLHVLPTEKIKMLSSATRKVLLDDLKISETGIDVPFVISQIERDNVNSGRELTTKYGGLLADADPSCFIGCQNVGECKGPVLPPPDPDNDFTPDTRGEVEVVGLQNLLIVRQKLLEYRDGEISHIENVLQSEEKGTTNRRLDRTEVTTVEEVEKEKTVENELQTTDKYELQSQASQVIQEDKHLEAGVSITASYGPVSIETHGNYASNTSNQESKNSSSTFARDVTSRSLQRIRERVLTRRTRTEITENEVTNVHKFVNTSQGAHNISGIYRWVDKFYEAQIVNYGQRLMLEFMIPEPAAFYRYALTKRTPPTNVPRPEAPGFCCDDVFYPLSPDNLQSDNYLCFVSKYNAKNVTGPPPLYLWITDMIKYKIDSTTNQAPFSFAEPSAAEVGTLKVPDGYFPKTVRYHISGSEVHSVLTTGGDHDDNMFVQVTIANHKVWSFYHNEIGNKNGFDTWPDIGQVIEWGSELSDAEKALGSEYTGNIDDEFILPEYYSEPGAGVTESIKISMTGHSTLPISVAIHYKVLCERSQASFPKVANGHI